VAADGRSATLFNQSEYPRFCYRMSAPGVCLSCEPRRKLCGSQSWANHCTRRPQMAHPRLSGPRSPNQEAQLSQPNDPRQYEGSPSISDKKTRERDLGRDLEGAKITLNEYLDRWLETAVRPRVRPKTFQDYQGVLQRYVRPVLGERVLAALRPLDLQAVYQQMSERGLSARTVLYAHVVLKCAMQQAVRWRLLL
jgi:Phage integrase, N-terminal SAM-like domain